MGGALLCLLAMARAGAADLTELTLEQLLNVEVIGASKFQQRASDAPASVSVITAEDIRTFGYRTLGDALRSVRGFNVTYDRQYEYVGVRGFARPGDFNSRVLVTVDGHRINDALYDQGFIGNDFPLDLEGVERIEVIRGPGSSVYGSNAVLAVINVVTRRPGDGPRAEVAAEAGSFGFRRLYAGLNRRHDNGSGLLLSASRSNSLGQTLDFPGVGRSGSSDYEDVDRFYGKHQQGGMTLAAGYVQRTKGNGAASWGAVMGDPANAWVDRSQFVDLRYDSLPGGAVNFSFRVYHGRYDYRSSQSYASDAGSQRSQDNGDARWNGLEARVVADLHARHKLVAGLEVQHNVHQNQTVFDEQPRVLHLRDRRSSRRMGAYLQEEYQWSEALLLTAGARVDQYSGERTQLSPRFAAVWRAADSSVWKLLYGHAFRAPNPWEKYYAFPGQGVANPGLQAERNRSLELAWERYFGPELRLGASAYATRSSGLISQVPVGEAGLVQYQNVRQVAARGLELEAEQMWADGARLRASLSIQSARDVESGGLSNLPRFLGKLNYSQPLLAHWRVGAESQMVSRRRTDSGAVPGYTLVNLTLTPDNARTGWDWSVSLHNLLDRRYRDPVAPDAGAPLRDAYTQDGRAIRVRLARRF